MAEVKFKVELNKGRHGIEFSKLAAISDAMRAFLEALTRDLSLPSAGPGWVADNFENNSVDFDCCYGAELDEKAAESARAALSMVFGNRAPASTQGLLITAETRGMFARIARPIAADEVIRFGLYHSGQMPSEWHELRRDRYVEMETITTGERRSFGEVQGIVHAFFKEAERPYLKIRELSTGQLVNCYFSPAMYHAAVEVLQDPQAVVLVEGWTRENRDTSFVEEVDATDFRAAPAFSADAIRAGFGSVPDYTGSQSTSEYIDEAREHG